MRNLVKADLDRILRKKSIWIFLVLVLAGMTATVFGKVMKAPEGGAAFAAYASSSFSYLGLIIGFILVLSVYADDYKSMALIGVIGLGISREKFILAKFWDTVLILTQLYTITGLFSLVLGLGVHAGMDAVDLKYFLLRCFLELLTAIASVTIAGVFFYLTDNTGLGIFAYLCVQIIIPFTLAISETVKILGRFHPERLYLSGLSANILSDFMIGNTPGGFLKLVLLIAVYMGGAILAAILVFKRKELDF